MAQSKSQRIVALTLASVFLLTTFATAFYVVYEINSEDAVFISEPTTTANPTTNNQTETPPVQDDTPAQTLQNFTPGITVAELRFEDEVVGDGDEVQVGDTVTIHYTGALASDGTVFDSSVARGEPATFPLGNLIQGWQEGIPGMKVGGKRRLFIPAAQGYGAQGSGASIPPNADLVFDIELFETAR